MSLEAGRMVREDSFPRSLTPLERQLLLWVLPEERPGYRTYRSIVSSWTVAGPGRRGTGNFIMTPGGIVVDNESPLPAIFAYGVVRTLDGDIAGNRDMVRLGEKVKTVLLDGKAVLLVVPADETPDRARWQTCSRQQLKKY